MTLKLGSLYSGAIDAFAYAAKIHGITICWQVEIKKECHKYLKKNYEESEKHRYDGCVGKKNLQKVDIVCGGDPCQPHSFAGIRRGVLDDRYRWPEMFRIVGELRPNWVINENVVGSISNMVLDQKITDLESIGYACRAFVIPAVATGAAHIRKRVFLVAHANGRRWAGALRDDKVDISRAFAQANTLDTQGNPFLRFEESMGEPAVFPVAHGIPDRVFRLGAAGDSIVSTIPIILLGAIKEIELQMS